MYAGSIHLFNITGKLTPENVKIKNKYSLELLELDISHHTT